MTQSSQSSSSAGTFKFSAIYTWVYAVREIEIERVNEVEKLDIE